MAATIVQSAEGTSTSATTTASFSTTPTNGNVIILAFAADDYNGTPNSGWTQSTGMEQQTYHGGYIWWKVASGGSNSFQYTIGSATNSSWVLLEVSGLDAAPYDISAGQCTNSSAGSYTTPSITPTSGDRFLVAAMGSSASSGDMSADLTTWLNSFTHIRSSGPVSASGTRDSIGVASRDVTANGSTSYSSGASFPFTKTSHSGLIIAFKVASGGTAYTLTADAGSVIITGTAATPKAGRKVDAASGSMAITGTAASFTLGRAVEASSGAIAITGQDAGLKAGRLVAANSGAVVITGTAATLTKASNSVLVASAGAVAITGADVSLKVGRKVTANSGAVQITGTDAALEFGRHLSAGSGSVQITGTDADLVKAIGEKRLIADPGSVEIAGQDVTFIAPASAGFTSSGGFGTTWARKTLSQIEREKKAALKRAKKRVVEIIEADPPQLGELLQIVREEVRQEAVEFPSTVVNDIISRLHMQMRAALIRRIEEEEDEADAEFLLLVA